MNSPAEIANWRLSISAVALALPLFVVLNGASVTLPDSYYQVSGIPIHMSALIFLLLPKRFLKSRTELILLLIYLIYCAVSLLDSGERLQTTVQLGYFIYAYKILSGLSLETIKTLDRYIAVLGSAFIFIHVISISHAFMIGDVSFASANIFGFVIYQSHLSYPIVLILILISVRRSFDHRLILKYCIIMFVMLIELVLMRRVGFGLFLIFLILFERRIFIFSILAILAISILYSEVGNSVLEKLPAFERLIQISGGANQRAFAWQESLDMLSETSIVLVGNGLNNFSHNFFLHTITTHGLAISMIFSVIIAYYIYKMVKKIGVFNKKSLLAFVIIALDWNVNTNIYQPYYSTLFAFFLVSGTVLTREKHGKQ